MERVIMPSDELLQLSQQLQDLYNELFKIQESKYRPGGWWLDELEQLERFECDLWESIQNCEDELDAFPFEAQS
jgi:hypothetical protein